MSDDVVIVSTARTPIGKAYRGAFNDTQAQTLGGHAIAQAVSRAGIDGAQVEEVVMGAALQQGSTGTNVARQCAIRAGLPTSVPAMSVDRQCSSGLMSIASIAGRIRAGEIEVGVAGGVESISLVQNEKMNVFRLKDPWIAEHRPDTYMTMLETAEIVADRYGVSREAQDAFAAESHARMDAAIKAGRMDAEIAPMTSVMKVKDKETGEVSDREVTLKYDEGLRAGTTAEGLAGLQPVFAGGQQVRQGRFITAGNASQLSDGAAALVMMSASRAAKEGLTPLAVYRGMAAAGCDPDEMGIGPVFAVPKLLEKNGLSVDDVDVWELNEAFASQCLYCRDKLGIDPARYNVNGGAIAIGHPYGMSGARMAGHLVTAAKSAGAKLGVVTMCIGGGMGAAGLFELN